MQLEMIVGPAGVGKTTYILDDIEKNRNDSNIIILTADQNSYNFEKMLCEKFAGTFNIDVMNFSSLTKKLYKMLLGNNDSLLTEDLKPFYLYRAALNLKDSNNFLVKRILQDISFITVVQDLIKELKEYNVDVDTLEDWVDVAEENKEKFEAILQIYVEYTALMKENAIKDKEDYVNELLFYIDYINLENYIFYIDAFYNFTAQEYYFISKLLTKAKKVAIAIIADANKYFNFRLEQLTSGYELKNLKYEPFYLSDLYNNDKYKLDIFRKSHEIVANLNDILRQNKTINFSVIAFDFQVEGVGVVKLEIKDDIVNSYTILQTNKSRFIGIANKYVANNYYKVYKSQGPVDDSVEIIATRDKEQEIKQVAREIYYLQKEKNIDSRDIAILYRDAIYEDYQYIFEDYSLNIHIDKELDVSNHRLLKFLNIALNFNDNNFLGNLLDILKTRLTNFDNMYKQCVFAKIVANDSSLSERDVQKIIKENNLDVKEIFKNYCNDNNFLNADKTAINVLEIEDVENILIDSLIYNFEDFDRENIREINNYSKEQVEICFAILKELCLKIFAINDKKQVKVATAIKKIDSLLTFCNIKMLLDKEDGDYDDIEELKLDSIDRQVYKKTLLILDSIYQNFSLSKFDYADFKQLLSLALMTIKYRSIPEIDNSIVMSTMDLAKVENKQVVFVIGFNKDVLPLSRSATLIDDNDKERLARKNIFLSPTTKMSLIDEEFVAYIAMTRAKLKTYITYSTLDKIYRENFATPYLITVKSMLPTIKERKVDKILYFDSSDYNYYLSNLDKIYTNKEFNYLFIKLYRRLLEIKDSDNIEKEQIINVIKAMSNYNFHSSNLLDVDTNYEFDGQLTDKLFIDRKILTNNYLANVFNNYSFSLSEESKEQFFAKKGRSFANFSISKLADWQRNPYLFFVKRVLSIKEKKEPTIDSLVTGNFFHAVMADESVVQFISDKVEQLQMLDIDEFDSYLMNIDVRKFIYNLVENSSNKDICQLKNLVEIETTSNYILNSLITRISLAILIEIKYSAVTNLISQYFEHKFNLTITNDKIFYQNGDEIVEKHFPEHYKEHYKNVPTINFIGTIDRIDSDDEKKYSIIDYKSSQTDINFAEIFAGNISQLLTYCLATEFMLGVSAENILGVFYREIAKPNKKLKDFRLRGIVNEDILLQQSYAEDSKEIMYLRVTKKGVVHAGDKHRAYSTKNIEKLVALNLENIMELLEKIYSFNYDYSNYEIEDEKTVELETLYKYSLGVNSSLNEKKIDKLKSQQILDKLSEK